MQTGLQVYIKLNKTVEANWIWWLFEWHEKLLNWIKSRL